MNNGPARWWRWVGAVAAIVAAATVAGAQAPEFAWVRSTPEEQGVDSALLAQMYAQLRREQMNVHSVMLIRHDRILSEAYIYPYTADTRHPLYSVSKSFTSALVGIAIEQGIFGGEDDRVADIFSGVTTQALAERMGRMRLRHLLSMGTGHTSDTTNRITNTLNWEKTFMELPVEAEPGSVFVYNSGGSYMLAAALQRKVGMSALEFADRNLFGPLGITSYTWDTSPTGVICGGWGLSLRPRDMARFGLMYLHGGVWQGRQVVPAAWVAECGKKQIENGTEGFWGSGYGYQFWLNDFGGYRADGAFAQFIFILPEYDAVVVFTCNLTSDTERIARLMRQWGIPAMSGNTVRPENPRGAALVAATEEVLAFTASAAQIPPGFTTLPVEASVAAGEAASFSVVATGRPAPTIQWYRNEIAVPGATAATLTIARATADDAGDYMAVLRNAAGAVASAPVRLQVFAPPAIVSAPAACVAAEGGDAVLQVTATGGDLSYEWRHEGAVVPGASGATLRLSGVGAGDAGSYRVFVRNPRGSVESAAATVTVEAADERARLVNLSARARASAEEGTLIAGLVIGGGEAGGGLPVLLRGVGPGLRRFDVAEALGDPALVLFRDGTAVGSVADWRGEASLRATEIATGAATLDGLSADAAMQVVLPPRPYTMHVVSSLPGRSGIALVECYDASRRATARGPRLVNLSARAAVASGDDVLIGGFVIEGSGELRVLVRGVGPGLRTQGVSNVLADPVLKVFRSSTVIAENDDWGSGEALKAAFAMTGAAALEDGSRDAALLVSLPAGVYTTHVSGKAEARGVALVEIYAVP